MSTSPEPRGEGAGGLRRVLGMWDAVALIVGITIGSGIFFTPPLIAGHLPATGAMLGIWLLGGTLALCGAFCYGELAGMYPRTGGQFIFLREGFGRFPAFAYGWCALLVTYPASIAAVSVAFTTYLARLLPLGGVERSLVAAAMCLVLAGINILGVRLGTGVLKFFTATKVLALSGVVILAFIFGRGSLGNLNPVWLDGGDSLSAVAVALALVSVIWTYEGWSDGPTLAGEVRDRDRDVVRALILATTAVVAIYLLANLAYVYVLGVGGVQATDAVAGEMAAAVFGAKGDIFVTLLVLVSTLGSIMGMIIGASRVFFAMGRERLFFSWVASVHPGRGTPAASLTVVGVISATYALLGSFEDIIKYFVFVSTIFVALTVTSVIKLRRQRPDSKRPFRVPLYPLPPLIYLLVAGGLLYQLLRENTRDALVGLGVVAASLPAFLIWERFRLRRDSESTPG